MVVTGPSNVRAIPWMGVCVCVGCVWERSLLPWLRRKGETWFRPNPTLIPSSPTKAQFLYHYSISVCTPRSSTLAEQCQEQFMGHQWQSLLQTSCHISSSLPPITLNSRVKKGQVRAGFGWPRMDGKERGKWIIPWTYSSVFMACRFFLPWWLSGLF